MPPKKKLTKSKTSPARAAKPSAVPVSRIPLPDAPALVVYQEIPAAVWETDHGLGFEPHVTAFDSSDREVDGEVEHISKESLRIRFPVGVFSGRLELRSP